MPITIDWANDDHTVLLVNHSGKWTWDEAFVVREDWNARLTSAEHPVHLIFDFTQQTEPPAQFSDVMFKLGEYQFPPMTGLVINVGLTGTHRVGSELFSKIYHKVHQVKVIEDAYALIKVHAERNNATA